jgi:amino acid adenylation domain-containing protein
MNTVEFIKELSAQGIELWRDGDRLRYRAPKNVLTPTLLTKIKHHKADILNLLHEGAKTYPLSHGQQALWLLHQMAPKSAAYNFEFALRIRSNLDVPALRRAYQALVNRHPALRTTFTMRDDEPLQQVHEYQKVCFEETDASTWTWAELNKRVIETYQRPFDLERGPLLRVNLFTRSEQDFILLLTVHHIVYDGWSSWLCQDELQVLYAAEKAGTQAPLPPIERTYADYVRWQTEMLANSEGERLWAYWQKQLAGDLPILNLPTDRPRPPVQTYHGASHTLKLNVEPLKKLTQTEGATLYMILVAAFQVLLHRYTSQKDILVGSPTAGRNQPEWAGVVGYFVNPVVLRANFADNPTFKTFLSQVRHTVLDALAHQDYPFPILVERLQQKTDPSYSPLFQVSFVLHKPQQQPSGLKESEVESFEIAQHDSQFDLTLEITDIKASLFGVFKYNTDLFDATTISRMAGHFQHLLEGIVAHPEQRISDLPLLTKAEQQQLLVTWNNTQTEYPRDKCIHQLFEAQVERTPDAIAVVFEGQHLSYAALNRRANQLAQHLQTLGVKPEVLVGICIERSLDMVIGLLGILKAGGAYLPLDPTYPVARLAFILEDAGVPILVTTEKNVPKLPKQNAKHQTRLVCLDTLTLSADNPNSGVVSSNLAYVIYTSGSTGKPKGVMISHQSVVNFLSSMRLKPGLTEQDILLAVTTISFDIAALEIYLPLMVGAQIVLVSHEVASDGLQLWESITQSGVTLMQATPATWRLLLSTDWENTPQLKILCGGEALPREIATQLLDKGTTVWNLYGPTETTIWSAVYPVERHEVYDALEPIGRPIANTQFYILDHNQNPVPIGVPGELHISGAGLARGYLNPPELTAEKFIPNPFSNGTRLYKTGDLARYLPDGNIEYLGRLDHQVKIRGFRIELDEIEAVLTQHPAVRESVVIAHTESSVSKRLVAYIVPNNQQLSPLVSRANYTLAERDLQEGISIPLS